MILCLDVGNTHIFGGVFSGEEVVLRFRYDTKQSHTSDQMGIFFIQVLRENGIDTESIEHVVASSVVPNIDYSLRSACIKYLKKEPFLLQMGVKTGVKIQSQNPKEVGSDIIAGCVAASHFYPERNLIVVDQGTATTISAVSKDKAYLGTTIFPGFKLAMNALQQGAALLPAVEIVKPDVCLGRNTVQAIQAGIYHGQVAAVKAITEGVAQEHFAGEAPLVVGTGGFSQLMFKERLYDEIRPDLVLEGLYLVLLRNL